MKLSYKLLLLFLSLTILTTCKKDELEPTTNYIVYNGNSGKIGSAGGEVTITDSNSPIYNTSITIPEGALSSNKTITIENADNLNLDGNDIKVVEFGPEGLQFNKPVKIGVPISGGEDSNVAVYTFKNDDYNLQELEFIETDAQNNIAYAYSDHFSLFIAASENLELPESIGTFTDPRDGEQYNWLKIGTHQWMTKNLAYLPSVSSSSEGSETPTDLPDPYYYDLESDVNDPYYYVYGYNGTDVSAAMETDNYKTYGVLYNWWAAKTACPDGWHLPIYSEWNNLAEYINEQKGPFEHEIIAGDIWYGLGTHLKATSGWESDGSADGNGTDDFGFTALPGGYCSTAGGYYNNRRYGYWWSNTLSYQVFRANTQILNFTTPRFYRSDDNFDHGLSVRCVRDNINSIYPPNAAGGRYGGGFYNPSKNYASQRFSVVIFDDGGAPVTDRGICWSRSENPTIEDSVISEGAGLGSFYTTVTGLNMNTTYYYRAYATNSVGTGYSGQIEITSSGFENAPPAVETSLVTSITQNSAVSGGNVLGSGSYDVTARGVCWNTTGNPTLNDFHTSDGIGVGSFTSNIEGLTENTGYYVRAYASNSAGTAYGEQVSFATTIPNIETGVFVDSRDNHEYSWTKIGKQVWMAENLAYLPSVSPPSEESDTEFHYYVYDYVGVSVTEAMNTDNYKTYGALYNWPAALSSCPNGWHLPKDSEWEQLAQFISDRKGPYTKNWLHWNGVGKHLKATIGWYENGNGTDDFGFSGLPGGYRNTQKTYNFYDISYTGVWWSSDVYSSIEPELPIGRAMDYLASALTWGTKSKVIGFSVRCVKD